MPRWLRVVRGMIGTGVTFAAGVGLVSAFAAFIAAAVGDFSTRDLLGFVGKLSVVAFLVGVVFSGVLAIAARGKSFDRLSFRFVTGLGAGGGFLYFLFIAANNGARVWSAPDAVANFAILTLMGGGAAAGMLFLARRAGRALQPGDEVRSLAEGEITSPLARSEPARSRQPRSP